jgi:hypothetical protein
MERTSNGEDLNSINFVQSGVKDATPCQEHGAVVEMSLEIPLGRRQGRKLGGSKINGGASAGGDSIRDGGIGSDGCALNMNDAWTMVIWSLLLPSHGV